MRSSSRRHISNSAKLAHSTLNPPFSRSQLKLPLLLDVSGDSALSGELPQELSFPPSRSTGSGSGPTVLPTPTCKSRQSVNGGALGPVVSTCSRSAGGRRKWGKNDILDGKLDWDSWG